MHGFTFVSIVVGLSNFILSAHGHGVITAVAGTNGVTGQGFGVIASTPRDGTTRNPFQQDSSIIRNVEINTGRAQACGRTLAGGVNDIQSQLTAAAQAGLPAASADGTVTMTLHQVNGDGAGPYTCDVSTDASGQNFVAMTVTTNVPGVRSRSNAKATDFALVAQMPASAACTGGPDGNACLVRCRNSAIAGPFGGCVAVTSAGNTTADTTATATTTDSAVSSVATDAASASVSASASNATDVASAAAAASASASDARNDTASATVAAAATASSAVADASTATNSAGATTQKAKAKSGVKRQEEVSLEEADAALSADLDRRDCGSRKRMIKSRVVGAKRAFLWL